MTSDWQSLERRRVAMAALNGTPIRTVRWTCEHAAQSKDVESKHSHPTVRASLFSIKPEDRRG